MVNPPVTDRLILAASVRLRPLATANLCLYDAQCIGYTLIDQS
jgi:hypothetical protein